MKQRKHTLLFLLLGLFGAIRLAAQTPTDALTMDRGQLCNALLYSNSAWNEYWEGSLRRTNDNIGTNTTQTVRYMAAYGVTRRLNVLASLPYIWTSNSQGHLAGQRGIQDVSLWVKYKAIDRQLGPGRLGLFGTIGGSVPASNYVAELPPMSIGMGASTASGRIVLDYHTKMGLYLTAQAGHTLRGKAEIDRDAYQFEGNVYNTNVVPLPNVNDASVSLGWRRGLWNFAASYEQFGCVSGDDIRRQDMPFLTNKMEAQSVGLMAKFHAQHLGFVVSANQVFAGRNAGRALTIQGGILYALYVAKKPAAN